MARLIPSKEKENKELLMLLFLTAAESRYFLGISSRGLDEHQRGYDDMNEDDTYILDRAQSVVPVPGMIFLPLIYMVEALCMPEFLCNKFSGS